MIYIFQVIKSKVVIVMTMTNQEKFKILADQIKIANQLETDILAQGELTRVDVSSKNRTWDPSFILFYIFTNNKQYNF